MKSLLNASDRDEILRRLSAIGATSQGRWGKMTAAEMVCHLDDALRVSMGEKYARPIGNWVSRTVVKWCALWVPTHWPHGFPTVAACDARREGTKPSAMEDDLRGLRESFERFTRRPREYALQAHPIFGAMNEWEWMRWGYLHIDHHLRQFGA